MNEGFVPLKSTGNRFGINKHAKVKNLKTQRIIKTHNGVDCYEHIVLCYNGKKYRKRVHRLMAEAFFNNAKYIDHIDDNKANNDITNLRPISAKENTLKGIKLAQKYHEASWFKSVKIQVVNIITYDRFIFDSIRSCEKFTGVDRHRIKTILRKEKPNYTLYNFQLV